LQSKLKDMTTIIRVEHSDGWGMFRYNYDLAKRYVLGDTKDTEKMHELHLNRNTPFCDGIRMESDMFCAFDSLDTFNALVIPKELKWLLNNKDFKVLMLDVTDVISGKHQVCYKKEDVLQTKDISSLFN
jgi:hypothetical protein